MTDWLLYREARTVVQPLLVTNIGGIKMDSRPIGFLDSGVGGLTVVKEMFRQLPEEEVIFIGDQARAPYGPRPAQQIREFTWQMVNFLLTKNVKMIVIACNTATAVAWQEIKEKLDIPVLGVILPGASAAIKSTNSGKVGIIGTPMTVKSDAYRQKFKLCLQILLWYPLLVRNLFQLWNQIRCLLVLAKRWFMKRCPH